MLTRRSFLQVALAAISLLLDNAVRIPAPLIRTEPARFAVPWSIPWHIGPSRVQSQAHIPLLRK